MHLRRSNKLKSEVSIDEPLNQDCDGNELLLSDVLGTDSDVTSRRIEEEIDKKLEDTCKERCSKLPEYNNGNLKVITYYTEAHSRYYLMKIYLDMAEANVIMKYSLVI